MKHQLVFNTADATAIAQSDSVGAYLRASDGTLLTHTDVGGKKALDVRVAEGINVEVDLAAADDSVSAWVKDGSGNAIGSTGGALHISDAGGSLTVDANNLDIRDLVAASDSVSAWTKDGSGTAITSTVFGGKTGLDAYVINSDLANTAIVNAAKTLAVADTAESVVTSALANRKYLWIHNNDNKRIYIGTTGVTPTNGFPMSPQFSMMLRAGAAVDVKYVGEAAATPNIRTLELS
jgi:hypothetical protein